MIRFIHLVVLWAFWPLSIVAQWPPAEYCLPSAHLKKFEGCIAMTDKQDECNAKGTDEEKLDCYCTQETLSTIFKCKDEIRRCLESHMFDPQFDYRVKDWHDKCDLHLTTSITTPPVTSLTATYDFGACNRLEQSCNSAHYETNKCSQTYLPQSSLSFVSCACQPPVYSLMSECQYNGNVSCKQTTAAESNIWGYSICSYFWRGSETLSSVDLTSMLSGMGKNTAVAEARLTLYTPATYVSSVASLIRSTIPSTASRPRQTASSDYEPKDNLEL